MLERPYDLVTTPDGLVARIRARGNDVLRIPIVNRGTAFTEAERRALGLVGLLPTGVSSMEAQVRRTYGQYRSQPDALAKHLYLAALRDRNEVLFYRLLTDHLQEMLPIVYTPTIGEVIERFSHEYNRPRGVFLSIDHPDDIEGSLANYGLGAEDCDLIVATDSEGILGIGDQGVGGIQISIGKLTVYTAAGGIHPRRVIPVVLDAGTDNLRLLNDELYLGARHARVHGRRYDEFIDAYVTAATKLFPKALLHWEDFGASNARRILDRYADRCCTFKGLLTDDRTAGMRDYQVPYAWPTAEVSGWAGPSGVIGLAEVVAHAAPTVLIGTSTQAGAFSEPIVRDMAAQVERPIILPLSNPTSRCEAHPADLIRWTGGRALVATGSPFPPVDHDGRRYVVAQANNALVFPGLGLGVAVSRARRISDPMLAAAADAVAELSDATEPGSALLPPVDDLRLVSAAVGIAVARAAAAEGLAEVELHAPVQQVHEAMWRPEYPRVEAV